jgi:hypothetical protein
MGSTKPALATRESFAWRVGGGSVGVTTDYNYHDVKEAPAPMVELVDTLVLEASTSVCEFESRLGHQISVM